MRITPAVVPGGYLPVILLAIHQAGTGLCRYSAHEREDQITTRLHKRIIRIPDFRDGPLDIRLQPEVPADDPDDDHIAGKIDLLVSCAQGHDVYFAIEAKRLRFCSSSGRFVSGYSDYIHKGMLRFISGQYALRPTATPPRAKVWRAFGASVRPATQKNPWQL